MHLPVLAEPVLEVLVHLVYPLFDRLKQGPGPSNGQDLWIVDLGDFVVTS